MQFASQQFFTVTFLRSSPSCWFTCHAFACTTATAPRQFALVYAATYTVTLVRWFGLHAPRIIPGLYLSLRILLRCLRSCVMVYRFTVAVLVVQLYRWFGSGFTMGPAKALRFTTPQVALPRYRTHHTAALTHWFAFPTRFGSALHLNARFYLFALPHAHSLQFYRLFTQFLLPHHTYLRLVRSAFTPACSGSRFGLQFSSAVPAVDAAGPVVLAHTTLHLPPLILDSWFTSSGLFSSHSGSATDFAPHLHPTLGLTPVHQLR